MGVLGLWVGPELVQEELSGHGRQQDVVSAFCVIVLLMKIKAILG